MDKVKEIDNVLQLLYLISVNGDAVDVMAAAKSKLRKLRAELVDNERGGE